MKMMLARVTACLLLVLGISQTAPAAVNAPPVVAIDGGSAAGFVPTGSLAGARNNHTATLLADGKVLVAGGYGDSGPLRGAELFDPATGLWTPTGGLLTSRYSHKAVLLADGKVLVSGGHGENEPLDSAEIYDPVTGSWTTTGSLDEARFHHSATRMADGKVLVAAGYNYFLGDYLDSAEIYDPATGQWTPTGRLENARYVHTATLLGNGRVLVAGGLDFDYLGSVEIYNPATGEWTFTDSLAEGRYLHTATVLGDGKVMVTGGYGEGFYLNGVEVFDPVLETWTNADSLADARYNHTATRLDDGKVLVAGGFANSGSLVAAEIFDPSTGQWADADDLATASYLHTATLLESGDVLIAGGYGSGPLDRSELYQPASGFPPVSEGSSAIRTGTYSDAEGNATASLSASVGSISADPTSGTWSWTFTSEDGPASAPVVISATDDQTASATVGFTLAVANVPPTSAIIAPATADEDVPVSISFTALDPGIIDQSAGFTWSISYGDGDSESLPAGNASPLARSHVFADPGIYTISVTSTDKDGGVSPPINHSIVIADRTAPSISPQGDVGPVEATQPAGATVIYPSAAAIDNSGAVVTDITYSQASGSVFPVGITPVTITATDASGNSATLDFNVNVVDTTSPLAAAPAGGFQPTTLTSGILPDYAAQLVASDLVGVVDVIQTPPAGSALPVGPNSISLVAVDAAGNPSLPVVFEVAVTASGLVNGGFENGYEGWTVNGNQSVQSSPPYTPTGGERLVSFNDGNRAPGGTLSQTFPTSPGEIYQLSFDMGVLAYNTSVQVLGVEINGASSLFSETFVLTSPDGVIRLQNKTLRFTADSPSTTLIFRDLSTVTTSIDLILDEIALSPLVTRTLTVVSSPDAGATFTLTPPDNNAQAGGVSNFTRRYIGGSVVNLTAASANNGFRFLKWLRNGDEFSTDRVVSVIMDGNLTLTALYVDSPPVIITQPVGGAVALGGTTTLSVVAEGTGLLTYQWRFNETAIPGADGSSLTISNMQPGDVGNYDVVISNAVGPVTSDPAVLSLVTSMLVNGSFEQGYEGWSFSGNQSVEDASPYQATDGVRLVAFNGGNLAPNGVLEQTFATTPGKSYTLSFDAGILFFNSLSQDIEVTVTGNGTLLSRVVRITGDGGSDIRWVPQTFTFIANSSTGTLAFRDRSGDTANVDLLLDHVILTDGPLVPNTAPVALDDTYSTTANTALVIPAKGVLTNDTDADSSPLTARIEAAPSKGTVTLNADGGFIYTPDAGYTGTDSFSYRANDGEFDSNIAAVTVQVNPPSTELIFNGGFESGFTGWITTGNQFIQSGAPYVPTEGSRLASFNAGDLTPNAVLSQSFATVAGQSYTLTFDVGAVSYNSSTQSLQVTVTGSSETLSEEITLVGPGGGANRWLSRTFTFVADSPISTLSFNDRSVTTSAIDLLLDHVRVTGVSPLGSGPPVSLFTQPQIVGGIPTSIVTSTLPVIGNPVLTGTPGDVTVRLTAVTPGTYLFESSEDLVTWDQLGERPVTGPGFLEFRDRTAPDNDRSRFYRIGRRTGGP